MKNLSLFCLLSACIGFQSCKKNESQNDEKAKTQTEKPISVACYRALYEKDTIELKINTLKDGKITGNMVMNVFDLPKKVGGISGKLHGDTLFVDYTFTVGNDKATFKNPMAMLKKGDELILGSGKIENYLGRSYFAKDTPIDYDRVKYKFTKIDCEDKQ